MAKMGSYCKAYPVARLQEYDGWPIEVSKPDESLGLDSSDGTESVDKDSKSADDRYFFLQENYTVTDGIFIDQNVVFDQITEEWVAFCKDQLRFEAPVFELAQQEK